MIICVDKLWNLQQIISCNNRINDVKYILCPMQLPSYEIYGAPDLIA